MSIFHIIICSSEHPYRLYIILFIPFSNVGYLAYSCCLRRAFIYILTQICKYFFSTDSCRGIIGSKRIPVKVYTDLDTSKLPTTKAIPIDTSTGSVWYCPSHCNLAGTDNSFSLSFAELNTKSYVLYSPLDWSQEWDFGLREGLWGEVGHAG